MSPPVFVVVTTEIRGSVLNLAPCGRALIGGDDPELGPERVSAVAHRRCPVQRPSNPAISRITPTDASRVATSLRRRALIQVFSDAMRALVRAGANR